MDSEQSSQVLERQAVKLVRLALANERKRTPLRREAINKLGILTPGTRDFPIVFRLAQEKLKAVFGMELIELPAKETFKQVKAPGSKAYVLRSVLPLEVRNEFPPPFNGDKEDKFMGVIMSILSLIFINSHSVSHATLLSYIEGLSITDTKDVRDLVLMMVKQGYLTRIKDNTMAMPPSSQSRKQASELELEDFLKQPYDYIWGPRAKSEVTAESLSLFIKEIFGDEAPSNLDTQLERFENERVGHQQGSSQS